MASFIIRLDDACPTMNHENWNQMIALLDKYNIKAIIGVIPDNKDPDFAWNNDSMFWRKVKDWQAKGHTIAMHGLHHTLRQCNASENFQLTHTIKSEFVGVPFEKQCEMIDEGLHIFEMKGISVNCFFAPAHTYDLNTVKALSEKKRIGFISDGYALRPYKKLGMTFLPSICDSPFYFHFGTFTFVFHPSNMEMLHFKSFEAFLKKHANKFVDAQYEFTKARNSQGFVGILMEWGVYFLRGLKK